MANNTIARASLLLVNEAKRRRDNSSAQGLGVFSGVPFSAVNKNIDFLCSLCLEVFDNPQLTKCGHSFCKDCIRRCLDRSPRCPKCNSVITTLDLIPNALVADLIKKNQPQQDEKDRIFENYINNSGGKEGFHTEYLHKAINAVDLSDINSISEYIQERKIKLEADGKLTQLHMIHEFLTCLIHLKEDERSRIQRESCVIQADINKLNSKIKKTDSQAGSENSFLNFYHRNEFTRMKIHNESLTEVYLGLRSKQANCQLEGCELKFDDEVSFDGLNQFSDCLVNCMRYRSVTSLATLSYTADMLNNASIVSSIEFDKDQELFAIAGVTKRIKLYNYNDIVKDPIDVHYPFSEMVCGSKISCISWNSCFKNILASSDYDCTVAVWDVNVAQKIRTFQEHTKRCWSIDFNNMDSKLLASGSDDSKVKLWSTNVEHSVSTLEIKANVCCVKFNPTSSFHLAFGSADHSVHYYDLRNTKTHLNTFKGHKRAVSYVKFLDKDSIVSASTDSQLKIWNIQKSQCERTLYGHVNEKNFVGLATDGNYIACGSESNSLYIYYRGLSKYILGYQFRGPRGLLQRDKREDEQREFVSAVCWRQGSPVVVTANSQGTIKILQLV